MTSSAGSAGPPRRATHFLLRCGIGLLALFAATLLRLSVEPLVGAQGLFVIPMAAVAIAAWFGGVAGGLCALIPSAPLVEYLVLSLSREPFTSQVGWATGLFYAVGIGLVWQVHRWRRDIDAERRAREEVRRLNLQLERRVSELEGLLALTPVGVAIASDAECRQMRGNEALNRLLAVGPEANVSVTAPVKPPWRICRGGRELVGDELPMQRSAAHGVTVVGEECDLVFDDGRQATLLVSATPLFDENGAPAGCIGVLVDISVQKRLEQELRAANRAKDEFLATLSHELRTPLNAILGWSQMLKSGRLDGKAREQAIEALSRNAVAQSRLIADVLDMSRMIAGKVRLEKQEVDLAALVRQAIASALPGARAARVALRVASCPPSCHLQADPDRLQQVLANLLSNAIKFTPAGGTVEVAVTAGESMVLTVRDNGAGIEPEFLPRVFERFAQADASPARRHGGLGLGLAIVRHLVELHGGTVAAASDGPGKGATFTVAIPSRTVPAVAAGEPSAAPTAPPAAARARLRGLRAFVLDDHADSRQLVAAILAQEGMAVTTSESAGDALSRLPAERPDVIVADIGMPEADGYEFARRLRTLADEQAAKTPAIALTAYASASDRAKALDAGFQEHLSKPVLPDALVNALVAVLESRSPDAPRAAGAPPEGTE